MYEFDQKTKNHIIFQTSTSAGWDGFMEPTLYIDGHHECKVGDENGFGRTCNNSSWFGYFYFIRLAYNAQMKKVQVICNKDIKKKPGLTYF